MVYILMIGVLVILILLSKLFLTVEIEFKNTNVIIHQLNPINGKIFPLSIEPSFDLNKVVKINVIKLSVIDVWWKSLISMISGDIVLVESPGEAVKIQTDQNTIYLPARCYEEILIKYEQTR